ncbi:sulfotransferase [Halomonas sp. BLK-85]
MIDNLFLSVGAMKAGTTWLYEQLKDHPDIYFTPEKEIHYFANKVGIEKQLNHRNRIIKLKKLMEKCAKGNPAYIAKNIDEIAWYANYAHPKEISNDWYESLFSQNVERKFCADFSNLYCQMGPDGWENVNQVAKNTKVIYTLRDPLSRLWSHYKFHMKWVNREDEALDAGFENFKDLLDKPWFWVNAEYAKNYCLLKEYLPEENLKLLYFEDFRQSPEEELTKVQDFIGVDRVPMPEGDLKRKVNATKDFEFPEAWKEYALKKLSPIYEECISEGILHRDWRV